MANTGREVFYDGLKNKWHNVITGLRPFVKPTLIVFAILCVGFLTIMRANFNYIDDMDRARRGVKGWENFSRFLTNFLATFVHGGNTLTDISPLPQLIALFIMAISGVMLLYILTGKRKFSWIELIIAAMLTINPYFLECISYKFDAPYMAPSVLLSILPFLFWYKAPKDQVSEEKQTGWGALGNFINQQKKFIIISILCLIGVCTTYQVSLAFYPMIVVVLAAKNWLSGDSFANVLKYIGLTAITFIIGILIFRFFIMNETDNYISTSLPALSQILPNTIRNYSTYYHRVRADFRLSWLILIIMIALGAIVAFVQQSKRSKIAAAGLGVFVCVLLGILCFGVYPLFEGPLFAPRAMYGFTAMVVILAICATSHRFRLSHFLSSCAIFALGWTFLNLSLTYGNALAYQQEYANFRIELLIGELNTLPEIVNAEQPVSLRFFGGYYSAPVNQTAISKYPVLQDLIPHYGVGDWMWGYYKFESYYGLSNISMQLGESTYDYERLPVLRETEFYTIRGNERELAIVQK